MIWTIARHEWRRLHSAITFWLLLAFAQLLIAWLAFAQLETFATIAPQLTAAGAPLSAMDLVVVPTFNSLVLLLLLAAPLLAMGSLAGEVRSGRIALWLAAPVAALRIVAGKVIGLWLALLPPLATCMLTLAALGLAIEIDPTRFVLAATMLAVFTLWLSCMGVFLSSLFDHPAAALAACYGILLFLWLLDSLSGSQAAWSWWALLPHLEPAFDGLLRSQDIVFFVASGAAAWLLAGYRVARRRGEL
ncbi:MAG: ABC transporter permease subunit [Chromatiaceae bacterium]|nr:ABC transporter permease subunit [Gammaproteobacteria bacterium]MCP5313258.1 ABC transporter permease subunit [Chromatiaceae bacterium]